MQQVSGSGRFVVDSQQVPMATVLVADQCEISGDVVTLGIDTDDAAAAAGVKKEGS